ncbi:hypothetical protein AB0Q95_40620 [Streptomyces sp. NPDC059900]|uniref:hypothetical protein n=1 Tax=Streptomyces sp. NPDC059900 TaxID=3155816 RepID=UPI0034270107
MFIPKPILVSAPADARVPLSLYPLPPGRLVSFCKREMNISNGTDGKGVRLSPQSFV